MCERGMSDLLDMFRYPPDAGGLEAMCSIDRELSKREGK